MQDLKNHILVVPALNPTAAVKASVNGLTVDTAGFESTVIAVQFGATGDTLSGTVYYELDIQYSIDGTNWVAAPDQYVQNAVGTANGAANVGCFALVQAPNASPQVIFAGHIGLARYVRVSIVVTGTMTNGTNIAAVAILGNGRHQPSGVAQKP